MKPKYWAIIILAALAVAAGVIYYANQPAWDLGPIVFHHKAQSPATSTPQSDLKDWKTYTNSQYGFELKYPADWGLKPEIDKTRREHSLIHIYFFAPKNKFAETQTGVEFAVFDAKTWDQYGYLFYAAHGNGTSTEFSVGGVSGTRFREENVYEFFVFTDDNIVIQKEAKIFVFGLEIDPNILNPSKRNELNKLNEQVLSNFKFTN